MKTTDQKVLITGATSGIGLALAKRFLVHKNNVIAVGRNQEKLRKLKDEHPKIVTLKCDLGNRNEVLALTETIKKEHSGLDVLINNAGIQYNYSFKETESKLSKIEQELRINLLSPIMLCEALLPLLLKSEREKAIVNVTSVLADVPKSSAPIYCGSKAGLKQFSKALSWQLADTNVRIFDLSPPLVETAMTAGRGSGKITPDQLVDEFWPKFQKNKYHLDIGKVKLLKVLNRFSPALAERILKKN